MRKVIVLEHISIDGVIQGQGGPEEATSGGFAYGGWSSSYSDDILDAALRRQLTSLNAANAEIKLSPSSPFTLSPGAVLSMTNLPRLTSHR